MQSTALSPKAIMMMSRMKHQLVLEGVEADIVGEMDWDYQQFAAVCERYHLEVLNADLLELSKEVQKGSDENTWRF